MPEHLAIQTTVAVRNSLTRDAKWLSCCHVQGRLDWKVNIPIEGGGKFHVPLPKGADPVEMRGMLGIIP